MKFFTSQEFLNEYTEYTEIPAVTMMEASEMIFAQVSPISRNRNWTNETVPQAVKDASMEQARFLLTYEIPHIDTHKLKAGEMEGEITTHYSTLALTILANANLLYRGNPVNYNRSLVMEWGD